MAQAVKELDSRPPMSLMAMIHTAEGENRLPPWSFGLHTCASVVTILLSAINFLPCILYKLNFSPGMNPQTKKAWCVRQCRQTQASTGSQRRLSHREGRICFHPSSLTVVPTTCTGSSSCSTSSDQPPSALVPQPALHQQQCKGTYS